MSFERFHLTLPVELYERVEVERKRLGQSRAMFIRRALEAALSDGPSQAVASESTASPRASVNFGAVGSRYPPRRPRPKGIA